MEDNNDLKSENASPQGIAQEPNAVNGATEVKQIKVIDTSSPAENQVSQAMNSVSQPEPILDEPRQIEGSPVANISVSAGDSPRHSSVQRKLPLLLAGLLILLLGLGGGYGLASAMKKDTAQRSGVITAPNVVEKELKVPDDATVIAECAKGRGKQYVLPKDIPQGPVYNVYNGKVIGIEYMLGAAEVTAKKDFIDLPLEGVKYDHVNIGLLSNGHSGFPEPHYHVDVFTVSHEEAAAITCQ